MLTLAIVNRSTVVSDAEAKAAVAALQQQVSHHFSPAWGTTAWLSFYPTGKLPSSKFWSVILMDNSDVAGALGYHETNPTGLPIGFDFVETDIKAGVAWSSVLSHEVLELLADPYIGSWAQMGDSRWTAWEVCDAVEADSYEIDGVVMSDFLLPAWFGDTGDKFSYLGSVNAPFTLSRGGYMGVIEADGTYHQITARKDSGKFAHREIAGPFSRRHRRMLKQKSRRRGVRY